MAFVEGAIFVVGATSVLIWNATAPIEVPRIDKPKLTVIEGGKNSNNQSKPMAPPLPIPQSNEKNKHEKVILYHYTSKQGLEGFWLIKIYLLQRNQSDLRMLEMAMGFILLMLRLIQYQMFN